MISSLIVSNRVARYRERGPFRRRASPLASQVSRERRATTASLASVRACERCGNGDVLIRSVNKSARKRVVGEDNKCIANLKIIGAARCASRAHTVRPAANVELLNRSDSGRSFHGGLKSLFELSRYLFPGRRSSARTDRREDVLRMLVFARIDKPLLTAQLSAPDN